MKNIFKRLFNISKKTKEEKLPVHIECDCEKTKPKYFCDVHPKDKETEKRKLCLECVKELCHEGAFVSF